MTPSNDPNRDALNENTEDFMKQVMRLSAQRQVKKRWDNTPPEKRFMFTQHASLAYWNYLDAETRSAEHAWRAETREYNRRCRAAGIEPEKRERPRPLQKLVDEAKRLREAAKKAEALKLVPPRDKR